MPDSEEKSKGSLTETPPQNIPGPTTTHFVDRVSVKIPPFWTDKPEIWFYQVEAQFQLSNVTAENTKFNYLVSQLDLKVVENIWDIATSEDPNKYTLAKNRLLKIFKESEEKQLKKLVSEIELGTLKPSQLLLKMKALAGTDISEKLLKTFWLDKLPPQIRGILSISDGNLDKLSEIGDRIWEMSSTPTQVNAISQPSDSPMIKELCDRIVALETEIKKLRSRSRSRSRPRSRFNSNGKYCYGHFRFGNKCKPEKCNESCQWNKKSNQGNSSRQSQ